MPKIDAAWLNSVFYLYSSRENALKGDKSGGTGFFVGYPSKVAPGLRYVYAVSNFHVVHRAGNVFVRAHTKDNEVVVVETEQDDWVYIDKGNDVTVTSFDLKKRNINYSYVPQNIFLEREDHEIGIGDEVFMLGRFVSHDGEERNAPAARFGAISIMPQPVPDDWRILRNSFCVDMHSRSGFSGSPVFVFRTPGRDLTNDDMQPGRLIKLLGIHWGQFKEHLRLRGGNVVTTEGFAVEGDAIVVGLSGMTCVAPAWDILETLEMDELVREREVEEQKRAKKIDNKPSPSSF